jgi:EAL domain-containing protein (putative c-di-GMP-specific phosphodiesterase class I)
MRRVGRDAATIEPELARALDDVLVHRLVTPVYQPVVDLQSGNVIGYEALARGPDGSPLRPPGVLFDAARATGRLAELDWVCRVAAVKGAMEAGLAAPFTLFCNVEPETVDSEPPDDLRDTWERATQSVPVMTEITERALTARPAELLSTARAIRDAGSGLALDDVGTDAASLALMPFLDPDLIKLDLWLIQDTPTEALAEVVNAVNAEAERSNLTILSEGIETEEHLRTSVAFGATLGQGFLFGKPGPLPQPLPEPGPEVQLLGRRLSDRHARPSRILGTMRSIRRGGKPILLSMTKHLETQAHALGESAVVLAIFEDAKFFAGATRARYQRLAAATAFVGVIAPGMPPEPAPGVRGASIDPGDELCGEWGVAVISPHFACTLVARPPDSRAAAGNEREFDFALTYNREFAVEAARNMMSKITPHAQA